MNIKLTEAQKIALANAQKYGSAWRNAEGEMQPWRVSKSRMLAKLFDAGLLDSMYPANITEAGSGAIA